MALKEDLGKTQKTCQKESAGGGRANSKQLEIKICENLIKDLKRGNIGVEIEV